MSEKITPEKERATRKLAREARLKLQLAIFNARTARAKNFAILFLFLCAIPFLLHFAVYLEVASRIGWNTVIIDTGQRTVGTLVFEKLSEDFIALWIVVAGVFFAHYISQYLDLRNERKEVERELNATKSGEVILDYDLMEYLIYRSLIDLDYMSMKDRVLAHREEIEREIKECVKKMAEEEYKREHGG